MDAKYVLYEYVPVVCSFGHFIFDFDLSKKIRVKKTFEKRHVKKRVSNTKS